MSPLQRQAEEQEAAADIRLAGERSGWAVREQGLVGEAEVLQDRSRQMEAQVAALEQKLRQTVQVSASKIWVSEFGFRRSLCAALLSVSRLGQIAPVEPYARRWCLGMIVTLWAT